MIVRSASPRQAFRTGGHTVMSVAVLYLLAMPVLIWITQDGGRGGDLGTEFRLACATLALLIGLLSLFSIQRVVVDPASGAIRYSNFSILHRWRTVHAHEVVAMTLHRAKDRRHRLSSTLELQLAPSPDRDWTTATLFDGELTGDGQSEPFLTIVRLVQETRPEVVMDAKLRALLGPALGFSTSLGPRG